MPADLDAFMRKIGQPGAPGGDKPDPKVEEANEPTTAGNFFRGLGQAGLGLVEGPAYWAERAVRTQFPGFSIAPQGLKDWAKSYRDRAESSTAGLIGEGVGTVGSMLIPLGWLGGAAKAADLGRVAATAGRGYEGIQAVRAAGAGARAAKTGDALADLPGVFAAEREALTDWDLLHKASQARTQASNASRGRLFEKGPPVDRMEAIRSSGPVKTAANLADRFPKSAYAVRAGTTAALAQPPSDRENDLTELATRFGLGAGLGGLAAKMSKVGRVADAAPTFGRTPREVLFKAWKQGQSRPNHWFNLKPTPEGIKRAMAAMEKEHDSSPLFRQIKSILATGTGWTLARSFVTGHHVHTVGHLFAGLLRHAAEHGRLGETPAIPARAVGGAVAAGDRAFRSTEEGMGETNRNTGY